MSAYSRPHFKLDGVRLVDIPVSRMGLPPQDEASTNWFSVYVALVFKVEINGEIRIIISLKLK